MADETERPSVLVVDDDADLRLAVKMTLEWAARPFRVVGEARSGEEAVARWRELRPDIVLLDAHLPDMDGLDVARSILAEDRTQDIVLCSGLVDDSVRQEAREVGVRAAVLKTAIESLPGLLRR